MEKLTPQALFLLYALPVMGCCAGEIANSEELERLENVLRNNSRIQTSALRKHFPDAVGHVNIWTTKNVLDYWLRDHNEIKQDNIFCQTYATRFGETPYQYHNQNGVFKGKELIVPDYINVDKEDIVSVHNFTIAQKLTLEIVAEYFPKFK